MKKKVFVALLSLICVTASAATLAACGNTDPKDHDDKDHQGPATSHSHEWSKAWDHDGTHHWHNCLNDDCTITDNSQKDGYGAHDFADNGDRCFCGQSVHVLTLVPEEPASCTKAGMRAYYTCSHCEKLFRDGEGKEELLDKDMGSLIIQKKPHDYENGICKTCGTHKPTSGLQYQNNGDHYMASGIGQATDTEIVIASEHDNRPVKAIREYAFQNCANVTKIYIPDSVTEIGYGAFRGCTSLAVIEGAKNVKSISNEAFDGTALMNSFNSSNDEALYIGNCLLKVKASVTEFTVKDGTTGISRNAFSACENLTSVVIPESVTRIEDETFSHCYELTDISVPDSLEYLGYDVFAYGCFNGYNYADTLTCGLHVNKKGNAAYIGNANNPYVVLLHSGLPRANAEQPPAAPVNFTVENGTKIIYREAFSYSDLTGVVLPEGLKLIDYGSFEGTLLETVNIPSSVTFVSDGAFYYCRSLKSITVDENNASYAGVSGILYRKNSTSYGSGEAWDMVCAPARLSGNITIPKNCGYMESSNLNGCGDITGFTLEDGYSGNLKVIGNSLVQLGGIILGSKNSVLPDDGSVTGIGNGAFANGHLSSLSIPSAITSISNSAFNGCRIDSLTVSLDKLSLFTQSDLINVTLTGSGAIPDNAFYNMGNLVSVTIPDGVTAIGNNAFAGCSSLTSLTLPDSVTSIKFGAFQNCTSLTEFIIPDGVTTINAYTFKNCKALSGITIHDGITTIGESAFEGCYGLTIYCEAETKPSGWDDNWNRDNSGGGDVPRCAIWNCKNNDKDENGYVYAVIDGIKYALKDGKATIVIQPASVTTATIHATVTYKTVEYAVTDVHKYAFELCENLVYTEYENAYYLGDTQNPYLILVKAKSQNITTCTINPATKIIAGQAFYYCNSLTSITVPGSVTTIGEQAFYNCQNISSITLQNGVTTIGDGAFSYCPNLTDVVIPDSITSFGEDVFTQCSKIRYTEYANANYIGNAANPYLILVGAKYNITTCTVNSATKIISEKAFFYKNYLTEVRIPDSVQVIGESAFDDCSVLENVVFPTGFDAGNIAFNNCPKYKGQLVGNFYIRNKTLMGVADGVTTVIVPSTVTAIAAEAFKNTDVKYVYIPSTVTTVETGAFAESNVVYLFYEGSNVMGNPSNGIHTCVNKSCTADGWIYDERSSKATIVAYIGAGGEVTIPAQINGKTVEEVSNQTPNVPYAFLQRGDINKINIVSDVTIPAGAFKDLTNLTEIAVADTVNATMIAKGAIDGCTSLTGISVAGGYDNYKLLKITFVVSGQTATPSYSKISITSAEDALAKIKLGDENTTYYIGKNAVIDQMYEMLQNQSQQG